MTHLGIITHLTTQLATHLALEERCASFTKGPTKCFYGGDSLEMRSLYQDGLPLAEAPDAA